MSEFLSDKEQEVLDEQGTVEKKVLVVLLLILSELRINSEAAAKDTRLDAIEMRLGKMADTLAGVVRGDPFPTRFQ